ncbi:MAG: type III-B CRISPR-associated protein Cas10/Cmr2 [Deltaproteobacteria bacterium]|nr:type III-B CRISPR-associated protein Cas10/Cmr2 [Deltaproteobacteria bacterium]
MMVDWRLKLAALLHDPPNKALDLKEHEREAFAVVERITGPEQFRALFGFSAASITSKRQWEKIAQNSENYQLIKTSDWIASAIDRTAYPKQVRLWSQDYVPEALIKHPFSGQALILPRIRESYRDSTGYFDQNAASQAQKDALGRAEILLNHPSLDTFKKKYLALWRALPSLVDGEHALLPPDTRMVDHTLWNHVDAASAVIGAVPQPTFLSMSIGPVQSFIAEARRTQDLWVGSYILSYLTWAGIRTIVQAYGPDAILYPALRGQPLVDKWLKEEKIWQAIEDVFQNQHFIKQGLQQPLEQDITIATIPNKFTAIVPLQALSSLPDQVEQEIRKIWREIAKEVEEKFPGSPRGDTWQCIWKRQVEREDFPEVYWTTVTWPDTKKFPQHHGAEETLRRAEEWFEPCGPWLHYRQLLTTYHKAWQQGIHSGTMYGILHSLVSEALDARKRTRNFDQLEEDGEKCTVINGLSALRTEKKQKRSEVRKYWAEVQEALKGQKRFHELQPGGR